MNLDLVKRNLLVKYPKLSNLMQKTKFNFSTQIKTVATNGKVININPNFMSTKSEDEQTFIIMHEFCHILFNHIKRSKNKIDKYWNVSTDAVINANLEHDGFKIPENGVNLPEAYGYDAEAFYEILLKRYNVSKPNLNNSNEKDEKDSEEIQNSDSNEKDENDSEEIQNSDSKQKDENDSEEIQNSDSNEKDENDSEEIQNSDSNEKDGNDSGELINKSCFNDKKENNDSSNDENMENDLIDNTDHNEQWNIGSEYDDELEDSDELQGDMHNENENIFFDENKNLKKKMLKQMKMSIQKSLNEAAQKENVQKFTIDSINDLPEEIDWKYILKKFEKNDIDWSYKNASIEDGILTSHLEDLPKSETEILLDTSGSISHILLRNFLGECKNILKSSNLKVGCFDTVFYGFKMIRSDKDINEMVYSGGGGTNFEAAINAFTGRADNMIIFTDGYANMPYTTKKIIWIVFGDKKIHPSHGTVIYISKDQYNNLCNSVDENIYNNLFR